MNDLSTADGAQEGEHLEDPGPMAAQRIADDLVLSGVQMRSSGVRSVWSRHIFSDQRP